MSRTRLEAILPAPGVVPLFAHFVRFVVRPCGHREVLVRRPTPPARRRAWGYLLAIVGLLCGCGIVKRVAEVPQKTIEVVVPGRGGEKVNPADLQQRLLSLADDASQRMAGVLDQYAAAAGTREAETDVLRWKLATGTAMMLVVTGPNPGANLVDILAMTMLRRLEVESLQAAHRLPEGLSRLVELCQILDTTAWKLADSVLTAAQQGELRQSIEAWHREHPPGLNLVTARPQEYAMELRRQAQAGVGSKSSVLSLLTLDPLLGLDPAVREVTQARLFAERAMYTLQRMPTLLRWQTELLTRETLQMPELQTVVSNTATLSVSADRVSRTAAELPERISSERERIMAELEAQEGKLRALAAEVREVLEAGQGMSTALGQTLVTFDALMKRFGVGEPAVPRDPSAPVGRPFDIRDYATTAKEITAMAGQLDATLRELGAALDGPALARSREELERLAAAAEQRVRRTLNHAFLLAAGLVVLAFAGALGYRRLAPR